MTKLPTKTEKKEIEGYLKKLYFVRWDRYVYMDKTFYIYGWINRKDAYKDFIVLEVSKTDVGYITSSADLDDRISDILEIGKGDDESPCVRVEKVFDIKNSIKL